MLASEQKEPGSTACATQRLGTPIDRMKRTVPNLLLTQYLIYYRWAPKTLRMLASEQKKLAYQNALLGMPASHQANTPPLVKRAIAQATILATAVSALL
jgi:hypothetical protein